MARNDSSIPSTHWRSGLSLRPSVWSGADPDASPVVLQTLKQTGDIAPVGFPPPWSLHLGISDALGEPEVRILANGFEVYFPGGSDPACIRCLMTADGLWTGQANIELHPSLFSPEAEAIEQDQLVLMEKDGKITALAIESSPTTTRFCLCADAADSDQAAQKAQAGIPTDLDQRWDRETALRERFWSEFTDANVHAEVLRASLESLVYNLELAGDGGLVSATAGTGYGNNALYPLIQAWVSIDPGVATRLLETAFKAIREDGTLAAGMHRDGSLSAHTAWPMLIQACRLYQEKVPDSDLITRYYPVLEKYLLATLGHMDPENHGLPSWPSAPESFVPDAFDDNVASASLTSLMLREIHALQALTTTHPANEENHAFVESERDRLLGNLSTLLWDEDLGVCRDRYIGGDAVSRVTLSSLLPLGIKRLPAPIRKALLQKLDAPNYFGGGGGLALWQSWDTDDSPPPAPSAHQLFVLMTLDGEEDAATALEEDCAQAIVRWFDTRAALPIELRTGMVEPNDPTNPLWYESPVMTACLALRVLPATQRRAKESAMPAYLVALDNHRFTILFAFILALVGLVAISILSDRRQPVEAEESATTIMLVRDLMNDGNYAAARKQIDLLKTGNSATSELTFIDANLLFHQGKYQAAIPLYEKCVAAGIVAPKPQMNLGLALYRAGRLEEAMAQYQNVIEEFGEEKPELKKTAEAAIRIIRVHGSTLFNQDSVAEPAE